MKEGRYNEDGEVEKGQPHSNRQYRTSVTDISIFRSIPASVNEVCPKEEGNKEEGGGREDKVVERMKEGRKEGNQW